MPNETNETNETNKTLSPTTRNSSLEVDIDLRKYIQLFLDWRNEIIATVVLAVMLAALAVIAYRYIQPLQYRSTATVVIAPVVSDVMFDERFRTTSPDTIEGTPALLNSRRATLMRLVLSGAVAQAVIDELGGLLEEEERDPAILLDDFVTAQIVLAPDNRTQSDLIRISIVANSPEKSAQIANTWAQYYVTQINTIYGQAPAELLTSVETELVKANVVYENVQSELQNFAGNNQIGMVTRQIAEKTALIEGIQAGKQTALTSILTELLDTQNEIIVSYTNAQVQNRLLAFEQEQEGKREMISAMIDAESQSRIVVFEADRTVRTELFNQYAETLLTNRILALEEDQRIRADLFTQYVETEIANRLKALETEQTTKGELFQAYADADLETKIAVFNEQVQNRIVKLTNLYETQRELVRLFDDANGLLTQVATGGEGSLSTNALAIALLKAEAYASSTELPGNMQFVLDNLFVSDAGELNTSVAGQTQDLAALVSVLSDRISALDDEIAKQSALILQNEDYTLLPEERGEGDPLFAAIQQKYLDLFALDELADLANGYSLDDEQNELGQAILTRYETLFGVGELADSASSLWEDSDLSAAIIQKYQELFGLEPLPQASAIFSTTTPIYQLITTEYPELFEAGSLETLTEELVQGTPLADTGEQQIEELVQLRGVELIPTYIANATPLNQAIQQLEDEILALEEVLESETARERQLTQARDLAWDTYTTLNNKVAELNLTLTAANSEVRLAAPAIPPIDPLPVASLSISLPLAAVAGFILAIMMVILADFMGRKPFLSRRG